MVKKIYFNILLLIIVCLLSVFLGSSINTYNDSTKNIKPIFRVATEEKKLAITFDINWAETEYLYEILQILDKYNVKCTFFIMGGWVNYSPENKEKLIKIKEGGHEIGNHSYIHPNFTKIDNGRILSEIKKTEDIVYDTIGVKTKLFRFPSGDYNNKSLEFVLSLGYKAIQWDVDSVDWEQSGEDIEYERVEKKLKEGSILLFHNNAKYTPKNIEKLLAKLLNDGYEVVPVGQLIYDNDYLIDDNGVQRKN